MRKYLILIRFPLAFTAIADVWAGYLLSLTSPVDFDPFHLLPLALIAAFLYCGGMAFNDVADAGRDKSLHPLRVIPSGRVSVGRAALLGSLLYIGAMVVAFLLSFPTFLSSFAVILLSFLYNNGLKRWRFAGSIAMGAIRGVNFFMGMTIYFNPESFDKHFLIFPLLLWAYIFILTMISTLEEGESRKELFVALSICLAFCVVGINVFIVRAFAACFLSIMLALGLVGEAVMSARNFSSRKIQEMVRTGVMAVIPFDAIMVVGQGNPRESLIVFALLIAVVISSTAVKDE